MLDTTTTTTILYFNYLYTLFYIEIERFFL
jgi:hypothetical protein